MANETPYIVTFQSGYFNVRSVSEFHQGFEHLIIARLNKGFIFWSARPEYPHDIVRYNDNDCCWQNMFPFFWLDSHEFYTYYAIAGFFNKKTLTVGFVAAEKYIQRGKSNCYRHTQHTYHSEAFHIAECGAERAFLPSDGYLLTNRFVRFIDWVYEHTRNGNTQNFARRVARDPNGQQVTLYGCRVLKDFTQIVFPDGTHDRFLLKDNWVWFSYGSPPLVGATNKRRLRICAWSESVSGTLNWGTRFADWGLDLPSGDETGHQYRIATLPTTTW